MLWIIKKELLIRFRYKMQTINLYLFPFFLIAPYVLAAEYYHMEGNILKNMILWIWMCQLLFGISDGIGELRVEGTFSNIVMSPIGVVGYLFGKYIFHVIDCIIITIVTLIFSYLFLNIQIENVLLFIMLCVLFSFSLFSFSLVFACLVLRFKKVKSLNYFFQQVFGFLSGYTNNVYNFPIMIRLFSFLIPLTYSIIYVNKTYTNSSYFIILLVLTIVYFAIGIIALDKEMVNVRKKGEVEQW